MQISPLKLYLFISGSLPAGATLNVPAVGGGSATATLTESVNSVSAASADKSLKMKIKRMKSGSRGNTEGKLEIVPQSEQGSSPDLSATSQIANGSPDPIGLSAAEIVAVVKQNVKPSGSLASGSSGSGKVRLTSSVGPSSSSSSHLPNPPSTTTMVGANGAKKTGSTTQGVGSINLSGISSRPLDKSNGASNLYNSANKPVTYAPTASTVTPQQQLQQSTSSFTGNNPPTGNGSNPEMNKVQQVNNSKLHLGGASGSGGIKPVLAPQTSAAAATASAAVAAAKANSNEPPAKKQKVQTPFFSNLVVSKVS